MASGKKQETDVTPLRCSDLRGARWPVHEAEARTESRDDVTGSHINSS